MKNILKILKQVITTRLIMASTARAIDGSNHDDNAQVIASRTLRKVDMRLIPLLFITYMFNFMDKTILSSASVFGLIDDTVCTLSIPYLPQTTPN